MPKSGRYARMHVLYRVVDLSTTEEKSWPFKNGMLCTWRSNGFLVDHGKPTVKREKLHPHLRQSSTSSKVLGAKLYRHPPFNISPFFNLVSKTQPDIPSPC